MLWLQRDHAWPTAPKVAFKAQPPCRGALLPTRSQLNKLCTVHEYSPSHPSVRPHHLGLIVSGPTSNPMCRHTPTDRRASHLLSAGYPQNFLFRTQASGLDRLLAEGNGSLPVGHGNPSNDGLSAAEDQLMQLAQRQMMEDGHAGLNSAFAGADKDGSGYLDAGVVATSETSCSGEVVWPCAIQGLLAHTGCFLSLCCSNRSVELPGA